MTVRQLILLLQANIDQFPGKDEEYLILEKAKLIYRDYNDEIHVRQSTQNKIAAILELL